MAFYDAFVGPGAIGTLSLDEMQRVASFAANAAAITCTRRGPDLPRRNELPASV